MLLPALLDPHCTVIFRVLDIVVSNVVLFTTLKAKPCVAALEVL